MTESGNRNRARAIRTIAIILALAWPSCSESARRGKEHQAQTSRIVRGTNLVEVSVIVADKKGDPVPDLGPDDFVLTDDGHSERIQLFRMETNVSPPSPPAALPPDTYTNQIEARAAVPPNVTIVLLDGLNTPVSDQDSARQQVINFLEGMPRERLAIYVLGTRLHVLQDFTDDPSVLTAALSKYSGESDAELVASTPMQLQTGNPTVDAWLQDAFQQQANAYIEDRLRTTVNALIAIAQRVAALPGRKNLLWVSGGFPFSVQFENLQDIVRMLNNPQSESNLPGQQLLFAEDVERAARALTDADVAVYPVDARGLLGLNLNTTKNQQPNIASMNMNPGQQGRRPTQGRGMQGRGTGSTGSGRDTQQSNGHGSLSQAPPNPILDPDYTTIESMEALADGTGGEAFFDRNDVTNSLRRAIEDSRATYELGYYPANVRWDGSFHKIAVRVTRPDVTVRARKGYFALPKTVPTGDSMRAILANAAASPLEATELGVAVRVVRVPDDKGTTLNAMVFFDPTSIEFESRQDRFDGNLSMAFVQLDAAGEILDAPARSLPLSFSAEQYAQFVKRQVEITQPINIVAKAWQLRVVIWDGASGKVGSVAIPLAKYLPAAPRAQ